MVAKQKNPHPHLERLLLRFSLFQFEIYYKPGRENIVADMLSRLPDEGQTEENPELEYFDVLVALLFKDLPSDIEFSEGQEMSQQSVADVNYAKEIALVPSSTIQDSYEKLREENA